MVPRSPCLGALSPAQGLWGPRAAGRATKQACVPVCVAAAAGAPLGPQPPPGVQEGGPRREEGRQQLAAGPGPTLSLCWEGLSKGCVSVSLCLSVCRSLFFSVCLSVSVPVSLCLSISLSQCLSLALLSFCLPLSLSIIVYVSVCLSLPLSLCRVLVGTLSGPTSAGHRHLVGPQAGDMCPGWGRREAYKGETILKVLL